MKRAIQILFLLTLLGFKPAWLKKAEDWHLKKLQNGISVYTRDSKNSKYKELKAVYEIKSSMSSVIALLNDADSYPLWVYRCGKSKILKKTSDQDLIRYQSIIAPWPVDNRDMVVEARSYQDEKTGIVYQKVSGIPDYIPSVPAHVRVKEFRALWTLTPLKNGLIQVDYELLVNPGGNIPAWVVNMAVVDGPYETSVKMKEWIMKEKYQKTSYSFIKEPL